MTKMRCPLCDGQGTIENEDGMMECYHCDGKGLVNSDSYFADQETNNQKEQDNDN